MDMRMSARKQSLPEYGSICWGDQLGINVVLD